MFPMVWAQATFAGVVGKSAELRTLVQRAHRVGAQRAETHSGDVEYRGRVGLQAIGTANYNPKRRAGGLSCSDGVAEPLEGAVVDIELRAEGDFVELAFGALVHNHTLLARKRCSRRIVLQEVLTDLGPDVLE